jgi:DNA-binding ferritin-like protein
MFTADQFRAKAAECAELTKTTDVPSETREFQRSKQSVSNLAKNEDWLADNFNKIIHSRDNHTQDEVAGKRFDSSAVAETEEHILRCLGAAIIMQ